MHLRITLIISFCLAQFVGQCQSPADWWYFGDLAGIHFTPSGPVADTNGAISTNEGCASISDNGGNLLFYTDGTTVYNNQHSVMPNGTGLLGNPSSSQSAIIVPRPGIPSQYFIFTVSGFFPAEMNYSLVDMTLDGGLGDVVTAEKNILLFAGVGENVCAVSHANGNKFWILSHLQNSADIVAFEVSTSGVNLTPVISNTIESIDALVGSIKGSPDGNYIAYASETGFGPLGKIKLMDFDNSTGQITSTLTWSSPFVTGPYGAEFSADSKLLYVSDGWGSTTNSIVQYDITNYNLAAIQASEYVVAQSVSFGQIQLGPDEKIYLSSMNISGILTVQDSFLHRINEPTVLGVGCDFEPNAVFLEGRVARMGLPPFISSLFNVSFESRQFCFLDSTYFSLGTSGVDSVLWNFGDPASGLENTSTLFSLAHYFSDTGSFVVTLIAYSDTLSDTTSEAIFIYPHQTLELGLDTLLCEGETLELNIHQDYSTYLWSDSSIADSILISSSDQVSVTLFGVCDTLKDTINVRFDRPVPIDLGPDTTFCEGPIIELDADVTVDADYQWNTGDTADHITVSKSGLYIFEAENGCGEFNDSISVTIIPLPDTALLPPDTINCFDSQIILERPVNDSITYIWSDSTSGPRFEVDSTQQVWLAAFNECGFSVDTMNILFNGEIKTELGEDTNICDLDSIQLSGSDSTATYFWSTGDTTISIYTEVGLDENYIVTIFKGECAKVESKRVRSSDIFCASIDCDVEFGNVFSPNGDGVNDLFRITSDCDVYSFDMSIYNRWGQLVNFSRNVAYGWDGFINGEPAAEGVYYFVVEYKDFVVVDADRQLTRGSFTLTR